MTLPDFNQHLRTWRNVCIYTKCHFSAIDGLAPSPPRIQIRTLLLELYCILKLKCQISISDFVFDRVNPVPLAHREPTHKFKEVLPTTTEGRTSEIIRVTTTETLITYQPNFVIRNHV